MSLVDKKKSMTQELLTPDEKAINSQPRDYSALLDEKSLRKRRFVKWTVISALVGSVAVILGAFSMTFGNKSLDGNSTSSSKFYNPYKI
jgi:hypothetical protein